ncbi:hypothetical protein [Clostridium sp. AWRP]|uniref:hypothetical protein n=1 Tax=Clostridium sp. AWRP TaxID=2212991 RepID=UPI00158665BA|nr:hypothetical protein [Clostridium sp. AWRP]
MEIVCRKINSEVTASKILAFTFDESKYVADVKEISRKPGNATIKHNILNLIQNTNTV